jgi:DNA-binding GntR family transcriptional regulator
LALKPRYKELTEALRSEILSGTFPEGRFPTEAELCKRFDVSRFTVREALRTLQTEGLISRRPGAGTMIQPAAARGGALHQPLSNVAEILQYARNTTASFVNKGEVPLPKSVAEHLGLVAGGRWTHFEGLRTGIDNRAAIAVFDAYVHESLREAATQVGPNDETIFRQLERLAGVAFVQVTQDIQAVSATNQIAEALGMTKRAPCLRIIRCYRDANGRILEISVSHHPGNRFAYSMHIEVDR